MSVKWVEVVDRSHRKCLPFPLLPCKSWMFGKENPNRKKFTLGEPRHRGFLVFLVVDNICYIFLTVRQAAFAENYALAFCLETYSEVWQGKPIYRWHLDLVTKSLRYINSLNAWAANCAPFWNQKLYYDTVFLHKNYELKNSSGQQFKA